MNTDKLHIYGAILLTGIILGAFVDLIDKHPQEPALSRYCVNYCIKEQLSLTKGDVEYSQIENHCRDFFEGITCCKDNNKYGECNIRTLNRLQQKQK